MKIPVTILTLLCVVPVYAQTPEMLFGEANHLYQEGRVAEAREMYERILSEGYESPALYFNLGNACYKSGMIPRAILNYERALRLAPTDDDILYNLRLAQLQLTDKIETTPRLFLWDYWDGIKAALSPDLLTILAYIAFLLVLVSAGLMMFVGSFALRKFWFIFASAFGVFMLICASLLFVITSDRQRADEAIIMVSVATIKNEPSQTGTDAFVLHGGTKVFITGDMQDWLQIRLADGKVGWMERNAAEII